MTRTPLTEQVEQLATTYGKSKHRIRDLLRRFDIPVNMTEAHHETLRNYFATCRNRPHPQKRRFPQRVREILWDGQEFG